MDQRLAKHIYLNLCRRPFGVLLERGKTAGVRLAEGFAALAGATEENGRFKKIVVRPDWMDSSDLFGHRKLDGTFVPGAILDFLKQVEKDPENAYFLCFSQLSLSRAEYWLREVLDAVAARETGRDYELANGLYYGSDRAAQEKYGTVCMPRNLFFFATVDLNEASLPLNQKFLDRTWAMRVEEQDRVAAWTDTMPPMECSLLPLEGETVQQCFQTVAQINRLLLPASAYIGYQIRNEIAGYLEWNRRAGLLGSDEATDLQICQRILPRVQGSAKNLEKVLEQLEDYCRDCYPRSAAEVRRMLAACQKDGYASYWE